MHWSVPNATAVAAFISAVATALYMRRVVRQQRARTFFRGKHVWITGASSGIGEAVAKLAARSGARVTLSARRADILERIVSDLTHEGFAASAVPFDVAGAYSEVAKAHAACARQSGPVDVLIANAGINNDGKFFLDVSEDSIADVIAVNLRGTAFCVKAVVESMVARGSGVLAAVSSLSAYRGLPRGSVYGATKAATLNFMESLRVELYGSGIKVVCINPGFVATPALDLAINHAHPFLMSSDQAAEHVLMAVASGCPSYGFPLPMEHVLTRVSRLLPPFLYDPILHTLGG